MIAAKVLIDAGTAAAAVAAGQRKAVGTVLDWPEASDRAVIGLAVIAAGCGMRASCSRAVSSTISISTAAASDAHGRHRARFGRFLARGLVFCMIGWFLVESALDDDPTTPAASTRRCAARRLRARRAVAVVAVGLIVFGVYRIIEAACGPERVTTPDTCRWRCRRRLG